MNELDEMYKKYDNECKKNTKKVIIQHNNDIFIIEDVIKEILSAAKTNFPMSGYKMIEILDMDSNKLVEVVSWEFFPKIEIIPAIRETNHNYYAYAVLSSGRLVYRVFGYNNSYIQLRRMNEGNENLSDCLYWHFIGDDAEKYEFAIKDKVSDIRREIVNFAVEELCLEKKDEWLYEVDFTQ